MTYVEFASLMTSSVALGLFSLAVIAKDPAPLKEGSVCMVTRANPEASPGWACGLPVSKIQLGDARSALPGTPVRTALGEDVGVVYKVDDSGTSRSITVDRGKQRTMAINASNAYLLKDQKVLVTDKSF